MSTVPADYYDQVLDILDDEGSIDVDERSASWRSEGWTGASSRSCQAAWSSTSIRVRTCVSTVVQAAKEMRECLDDLGLVSFCKTTGGKGLHVVTPLAVTKRSKLTWPEAKGFAHDVCLAMARDSHGC